MLTLWILLLTGSLQTPSFPATESLVERWPSGKVKCERKFYLDDDGEQVLHGPFRERDGIATYLYPDGLVETDWYPFAPREPGPVPERFQDFAAFLPPATSVETDARLQVFLNGGPSAQ